LDSYNAIDIALDTTPWSGATTAFEALGMGVPLVAICGDTTSGRMSTSVVSAAEMPHLVTKTPKQFATAVAELCEDYLVIRKNKADSQKKAREGILFDESRICTDFFSTINSIITGNI
jgi:predicted O-linked N-acetylglucosamine transferase (SPINDLY family)